MNADKMQEQKVVEELRKAARKNPRQFQQLQQLTQIMNRMFNENTVEEVDTGGEPTEANIEQIQKGNQEPDVRINLMVNGMAREVDVEQPNNLLSPVSAQLRPINCRQLNEREIVRVSSYRTDVYQSKMKLESLARSHGSSKNRRTGDKQSNESSIRVNLKSNLSGKHSGNTLKQSDKQGQENEIKVEVQRHQSQPIVKRMASSDEKTYNQNNSISENEANYELIIDPITPPANSNMRRPINN